MQVFISLKYPSNIFKSRVPTQLPTYNPDITPLASLRRYSLVVKASKEWSTKLA